jgi:hypothetical protein
VVTHGHTDHFFGAGPVLEAFPDAPLIAGSQGVVEETKADTTAQRLALWNSWFAGQFPASPVAPTLADSDQLALEGHSVLIRTIGHADADALNTIVHVPERQAICSTGWTSLKRSTSAATGGRWSVNRSSCGHGGCTTSESPIRTATTCGSHTATLRLNTAEDVHRDMHP